MKNEQPIIVIRNEALAKLKAEGMTLDQIVDHLRTKHGVDVSRETVRRRIAAHTEANADA